MNFFNLMYQINIFPDESFKNSDLNSFYSDLSSIPEFTDGQNIVIPIPMDAPANLPRIVLQEKTGISKAEISFQKISISLINNSENKGDAVDNEKLKELTSKIIKITLGSSIKIKRIGLVKQFVLEVKNQVLEIKNKVLPNETIIKDLSDFELRFTYKSSLKKCSNCNESISIASGQKIDDAKHKVIIFSSDFNTHQDEDMDWSVSDVLTFIDQASLKQDNQSLSDRFFG